jgi:serine/threonine protein kinase
MEIIKKLGTGGFSKVYLVKLENGSNAALKIPRKFVKQKNAIMDANKEITFLKKFSKSEHIINLISYEINSNNNHIILEVLGDELYSLIKLYKNDVINDNHMPLNIVNHFSKQILYGLQELEAHGIIHNDLKPENILFTTNLPSIIGLTDDLTRERILLNMKIKITDFGNASSQDIIDKRSKPTRYYISPEILLKIPFTIKSDMWGFACILYEMISGTVIFDPFRSNKMGVNSMHLLLMNKVFGKFPKTLLKKSKITKKYFTNGVHNYRYLIEKIKFGDILYEYIPYHNMMEKVKFDEILEVFDSLFKLDPDKRLSASKCLELDWFA